MQDVIMKIESNIDDSTGETLGFLMELLFDAGACDVYYTPIYMKKNRPAWQLNVLCKESDVASMEELIMLNTTTIGVRRCLMEREICERDFVKVTTSYGDATVKICRFHGIEKVYPEYETVVSLCKATGLAYPEMYRLVVNAYQQLKEEK